MKVRWMQLFLLSLLLPGTLYAQGWGTVTGVILDSLSGKPIAHATILVQHTNYGTAASEDGSFALRLPVGTYSLLFSAVGYRAYTDSVVILPDRKISLSVKLAPSVVQMEQFTLRTRRATETSVYRLDPEDIRHIPAPFKDGFRMLKLLPGVATNNELSGEYSVRGGGYNENLIFLNGFEIYRPFRARKGEQEGLGLINPELTRSVTFYAGGFPPRYGGKLSSALDVRYDPPLDVALQGAAYGSLLDAGVTLQSALLNNRLRWALGYRKARPRRFFETQELKGTYDPTFSDLQALIIFQPHPAFQLEGLAIQANQQFRMIPTQQKTYYGTYQDLRSVWINFSGKEEDGYTSRLLGIRARHTLSPSFKMAYALSQFETDEREQFDISGNIALFRVKDPTQDSPDNPDDHIPLGNAFQADHANNRIRVRTLTFQHEATVTTAHHTTEAGWFARQLTFEDWLSEGSLIRGKDSTGTVVEVPVDVLQDTSTLHTWKAGGYLQHSWDIHRQLMLMGGIRADYFAFNGELTLSPRLIARYILSPITTLNLAIGIYYQEPSYRELRGRVPAEASIETSLNRNLRAQRSVQAIAGIEHFLPSKRLYLRAEAYIKWLDRLISYDVQNVRVIYSGVNDSKGYTYGLDLQVKGEFVPGLESWVNYSYMVSREKFLPAYEEPPYKVGWMPRPTDQRHTFSLFVQDYVPGLKNWRLHLRMLFGSGFPFTSPRPGRKIGNITIQEPGYRNRERYPAYRRVDIGATRELQLSKHPALTLEISAELLNVFDMVNTVQYTWITGADGIWQRVPTHLTPRTFNIRLRIAF